MRFFHRLRGFLRSESGPTATEYAVALALIIVVAIVAVKKLGVDVKQEFTTTSSKIPKHKAAP